MVLTDLQIAAIEELIKKNFNKFILLTLGADHLTRDELKKLAEQGVLSETHSSEDFLKNAYLMGKVRGSAGEKPSNISYADFKRQLFNNPVHLTQHDMEAVQHLKEKAGNYLTGLRDRVQTVVEGVIRDNNHEARLKQINQPVKDAIVRATEESRNINKLVQDLRNQTGDIFRDWQRVAVTELSSAHNQASVQEIAERNKQKKNEDILVYCVGPLDGATCEYCRRFYHEGGSFKVYRLSELIDNGTNHGKKVAGWLPTIPPLHPRCRHRLVELPQGWTLDENGTPAYVSPTYHDINNPKK